MELVLEENKTVFLKTMELIEEKEELNKASSKVANFTTNESSRTIENQRKRGHDDIKEPNLEASSEKDIIKDTLILNECGTLDYGLLDNLKGKAKITQAKPYNESKIKKPKNYEDIYNSVWAPKGNFKAYRRKEDYYYFTL